MKQLKRVIAIMLTLVLSISIMSNTKVSAATNSKKQSFSKVAKYIKSNGDFSGKTYWIQNERYRIYTNKKCSYIEFHYIDDGINVKMTIKKKSMSKVKVEFIFTDINDYGHYQSWKASRIFKTSKFNYRNTRQKYKIYSIVGGIKKSTAKYYTNQYVNQVMKNFNYYLKSDMGITLKNLGFKKCK